MPTGMLFWPTTEEGKAPLGISPSSTSQQAAASTHPQAGSDQTPPDLREGLN